MTKFAKAMEEGRFYVGKVCNDCLMIRENGDGDGNDPDWDGAQFTETLNTYDVSLGHPHFLPQWFNDCSHIGESCSKDTDCDCERNEFSKTPCDMCGTDLHGERHDYIFIERSIL